ncbi:Pep3/Vps18/deep orange family-domain-containing protein [Absidia repens]|uniref:Pep3/Vps18/deep orange family-domain-containing protein n=1 Tax=Absidia repens TaxID=90262 RepID=A0A1X2IPE8_9FUNG|nr:Pep3/Vps18/deep orange family-domain-containing protein [Absidia repens]
MSLFDDFLESTEETQKQPHIYAPTTLSYQNGNSSALDDNTSADTNQASSSKDTVTTPTTPTNTTSKTANLTATANKAIKSIPSNVFHLDYVQFQLPALLVHLVVSNNILISVLSNNHILRIDLDNPLEVEDIEWVRKPNDGRIISVFFDPTGRHLIISTEHGENYYLFDNGKKTKNLTRLKGLVITAIGWNLRATTTSNATREILLGIQNGEIYETWIEPTDEYFGKEEHYAKLVYQLPVDPNDAASSISSLSPCHIVGLHFDRLVSPSCQDYIVMVTTANRIYQFMGIAKPSKITGPDISAPSMFESLFARYSVNASFQELPGDIGWSDLSFHRSTWPNGSLPKDIFAWVTGPGIYQGRLALETQHMADDMIDNAQLIPYPVSTFQDHSKQEQPDIPVAISLTTFHIIFLYQGRVKVLCHLNGKIVYDEAIPLMVDEKVQGLAVDSIQKTYWIYTTAAIYEMVVKNEDGDVWKLYLDKKEYSLALDYCKTPDQRNKVHVAHADQLFSTGQYKESANYYAMTNISFEQAALKFITRNEKDALRVYLLAKLKKLDNEAKTQKSILATWLVEIYLAKINQYHEMGSSVAYTSTAHDGINDKKGQTALDYYQRRENQTTFELKQLLTTYQDYLHKETVYKLVSSHGHNTVLVDYATLIGDDEKVIRHWITERNWIKALEILAKQVNLDMFYTYSPVLMEAVPRETHQAIRYLSHVVTTLANTDPAIHNSLLALYATQSTTDETALLSFLKNEGREMFYNPDYALRLCTQFGRVQSCIHLYSLMGLYEEAVHLALKVGDIDLARIHADKPLGDDEMSKKLWLAIAKYVIQEKKDIKSAMDYVKQSNVLKIEDILPFFPDFVLIDEFKASKKKKYLL